MKINIGQLIYDQLMQAVKSSKGLWFPALVTKLCKNAGVKIGQGEERIKPRMPTSTRILEEPQVFPGVKSAIVALVISPKALNDFHGEVKKITEKQEKLFAFEKFQYDLNQTMLVTQKTTKLTSLTSCFT